MKENNHLACNKNPIVCNDSQVRTEDFYEELRTEEERLWDIEEQYFFKEEGKFKSTSEVRHKVHRTLKLETPKQISQPKDNLHLEIDQSKWVHTQKETTGSGFCLIASTPRYRLSHFKPDCESVYSNEMHRRKQFSFSYHRKTNKHPITHFATDSHAKSSVMKVHISDMSSHSSSSEFNRWVLSREARHPSESRHSRKSSNIHRCVIKNPAKNGV